MKKLLLLLLFIPCVAYSQVAMISGGVPEEAGGSTLLTDLEAYYDFEETTGDLLDATANNNDGSVTGTTREVTGQIGDCYTFVDETDYINIGSVLSVLPFTIAGWVRPDDNNANRSLLWAPSGDGIQFRINGNEQIRLVATGTANIATSSGTVTNETWEHIVISYDGTNYAFYIDGADAGNGTDVDNFSYWTQYISASHSSEHFSGEIDEVGIWSRVLTGAEVTELYNSGTGVTYPF